MKLVLAEKPSVAQSIAKVLGATKREDGYLEGNGYVVSWCVGHLVELSQPEAYDEKYNKWAYADLPIFPDQWKYQVSASTKKQFGILKKLMARKDVESLVCATDAGREGELIFRLVYQQAGCRKPFERLWISSMEDSAIREGFEQLKPSTEYDALYEAALCRERADWLVGINATRLFSTLYGQTLNVGRVMTPTLAMVVMREAAISAFRPEPFYTVELAFQDFTASGERMKQKVLADDVARKCVGSVLNVTKAENKEKSEKPPALYDLTSLQRDANRVLGFTAQQTLDYTQSLYEKKLVTYPRTDSRYLTSDMKDMLPELIKSLFNIFPVEDVKNVPVHAAQVINDKKVSDHHAIIPTKEAIKCSLDDLPKGEQAILRLIATRLFCAVGEPFRYNESVIELSDGNYIFSAKGKTTVQSGWKIFSGKPADKDKEGEKQLPSDNAREQGFFPSLQEVRSVGFPAETAELAEKLNDSQFRAGLKAEYQNFLQAHNEDSSLLRFHYHKLERLAQRLDELDLPLREYQSSMTMPPLVRQFITDDEINESLSGGSGFSGGKARIYEYWQKGHSAKEKADFLKNEYGTGGRSHALSGASGSGEDHDAKGIRCRVPTSEKGYAGILDCKTNCRTYSWY